MTTATAMKTENDLQRLQMTTTTTATTTAAWHRVDCEYFLAMMFLRHSSDESNVQANGRSLIHAPQVGRN